MRLAYDRCACMVFINIEMTTPKSFHDVTTPTEHLALAKSCKCLCIHFYSKKVLELSLYFASTAIMHCGVVVKLEVGTLALKKILISKFCHQRGYPDSDGVQE